MMADERDLLDKADALLRRHALASGGETGTYPVLTDLVVPPGAMDEQGKRRAEIVEGILAQLKTRFGVELEREVAEKLAPQLRAAVAEALAGLEERLAALVSQAVEESLKEPPVK